MSKNDQPTPGTGPIAAKKSFKDGHVSVRAILKCTGWGRDHAKIDAGTELTTAQARALAQSLVALADQADAKVEAKATADAKRQKWRDGEIAAGRMVVLRGLS